MLNFCSKNNWIGNNPDLTIIGNHPDLTILGNHSAITIRNNNWIGNYPTLTIRGNIKPLSKYIVTKWNNWRINN